MGVSHEALETFLAIEAKDFPLSELLFHSVFQPRAIEVVAHRHLYGVKSRSVEHVDSLLRKLQSRTDYQLDPILAAYIDEEPCPLPSGLYVIDGHHRVTAYSQASRRDIPCRVQLMSYRDALMISKLANCHHRAMKMHEEQRLEAAWQWMIIASDGAKHPLPKTASLRSIASMFDIDKNTVQRMKKRLREVNPDNYDPAKKAPETDWPRWKDTRLHRDAWLNHLDKLLPEERITQEARVLLGRASDLFQKASQEVRAHARVLLETDALYEENPQRSDLDYMLNFYR